MKDSVVEYKNKKVVYQRFVKDVNLSQTTNSKDIFIAHDSKKDIVSTSVDKEFILGYD